VSGPASYMRADNNPIFVQGLRDLIAALPAGLTMAEIGVFAGESTRLFMGSGRVARLYAVDPWAGDYAEDGAYNTGGAWHCPFPWADVRQGFLDWAQTDPRVVAFPMPSLDAAHCFAPGSLDFVYIDANHSYAHVAADILTWGAKVTPAGFIGGHDYSPAFPGVVRAVQEATARRQVFADTSWLCRKADLTAFYGPAGA
jgi:hypothetical protein